MNICDVFLSIEMTSGSCIVWPCGILRAFLEKFNISARMSHKKRDFRPELWYGVFVVIVTTVREDI